jgi:hypothetical protein
MMCGSLRTVIGNGNGNHYFLSQLSVEFGERWIESRASEQAVEFRLEI